MISGYKQGFEIITPESSEFTALVDEVCSAFSRYSLRASDYDDFVQLQIASSGEPVGPAIQSGSITPPIARAYWKRLREKGFVDFATIVYYSLLLLRKRAETLDYISARYSWILVDEFQDTSDLQIDILSLIAARGRTRFFLVGDPYQSIFSFAGARPDRADDFATAIGARKDFVLSGNFRSSPAILDNAQTLLPRTPPMKALGEAKLFTEVPSLQHGESPFEVITDYFLPTLEALAIPHGEAAILAPTWFVLLPLSKKLRDYGISVVGPGARPYRRNRLFAPLAEQVCGYLVEPLPDAIADIERSLFNVLLDATGTPDFRVFSYEGRVAVYRLLEVAAALQVRYPGATDWLDSAAVEFTRVLLRTGHLGTSHAGLFSNSVAEMKGDILRNRVDLANLGLSDLGIYASPRKAMKLSTIHNAKGREYAAVAMIDLDDGRIPFYKTHRDPNGLAEQKRLFYVGLTRAKRYLLYVTDDSSRSGPSRFLRTGTGLGLC